MHLASVPKRGVFSLLPSIRNLSKSIFQIRAQLLVKLSTICPSMLRYVNILSLFFDSHFDFTNLFFQRFQDTMNFINFLWSAPLQIIISLFFLYNEIGWAAFMALVVMVLIAPLSMFFTTKVSALHLLAGS